MSDGHGPTNADILKRLNAFAERTEKHEKRLTALEADRDLVHRLHTRVSDLTEKVTVVHDLLQKNEEHVIASVRLAAHEIAGDVLAGVRSEMTLVRGDVQQLRSEVETRPCLVRPGEPCPDGL